MKPNKQDMNGAAKPGSLLNQAETEVTKRGSVHGTEVVNVVD